MTKTQVEVITSVERRRRWSRACGLSRCDDLVDAGVAS
jgi:hypothetical protein